MFVMHNYDSAESYERSKERNGEVEGHFWSRVLRPMLAAAEIDPARCFFTNVLMGLKPGSAVGPMPVVDGYEEQCLAFMKKQIAIVKPSIVVSVGGAASKRLKMIGAGTAHIMHPSARQFVPIATRSERIEMQAEILRKSLQAIHNNA